MSSGSRLLQPFSPRTRNAFVCWRCQIGAQRRISTRYLKKQDDAAKQWAAQAEEIKAGNKKSMMTILEERGFVHALAGERKEIDRLLTNKRAGWYAGIDPTAPSLHVGHLLPLMLLFWLYLHGFHAVSLLGGSTARIGDPTGRTTTRTEMTSTERKANLASMHYQVKKLWVHAERLGRRWGYTNGMHGKREIVNNAVWWNKLPFLEVLNYLGRGLRLGPMLSRDTVKTKMESGEGISFSEFCYPMMQSWDFWRLYAEKGIQLQIGGQDQFGNIVSGIDAVKYIAKTHPDPLLRAPDSGIKPEMIPYGVTLPLLTTSSGEKFGKSAGNAIWLDTQMTSAFDLYGFFVRTADADVKRYLKLFTFIPSNRIDSICDKHMNNPSQREAQHTLAYEFLDLVHGEQTAKDVAAQHAALFKKPTLSSLTASAAAHSASTQAQPTPEGQPTETVPTQTSTTQPTSPKENPFTHHGNPRKREAATFLSPKLNPFAPPTTSETPSAQATVTLPKSLVHEQNIARVLYAAGLVSSRSEGHRLASQQGAYIGHQSGADNNTGKTEMNDQLSFTPAKLHDKSMMWRYVIKPSENMEEAARQAAEGEEGLLILRVGKWKVRVCRIVSDAKFETLGLEDPPGWRELKADEVRKRGMADWEDIEEELVKARRGPAQEARVRQQKEALKYLRSQGMTKEEVRDAVLRVWEGVKLKGRKKAEERARVKEEERRQVRTREDALEAFAVGDDE